MGDDDVDAKRFETVDRKTRDVPREERTRAVDWDRSADHIRARGHNGCIQRPDTWLHPNVSRKRQILFPCTAGAVHTWHDPEIPESANYFRLLVLCGPRADLPAD